MPLLKLTTEGRGAGYTTARATLESVLRLLYWRDWPATLWELFPGSIDVHVRRLRLPILPAGASPLRIGFISDIHIGPTTPRALVEAAFGKLAEAQLEVLLLGGDYVFLDATEERMALLEACVTRVPAKRKIGVLGNHDLWAHNAVIEATLERAGVEVLVNESCSIGDLTVVGLDEPWTGTPDAPKAFRGVDGASAVLVLCHSPDGLPHVAPELDALSGRPPAFYICGHTHGGHVATPWGPIVVPGPVGRQYPNGLYHLGQVQLYVSRGVGGIEIPVRTFAQPEVVVMELIARPNE
jgi:predicted MPP superfamily phosphohydrolase